MPNEMCCCLARHRTYVALEKWWKTDMTSHIRYGFIAFCVRAETENAKRERNYIYGKRAPTRNSLSCKQQKLGCFRRRNGKICSKLQLKATAVFILLWDERLCKGACTTNKYLCYTLESIFTKAMRIVILYGGWNSYSRWIKLSTERTM